MVTPPGEVLDQARKAAEAGDFARALESYEHFFDNALQDQGPGHNYYGVRLSYCLSEWARLGDRYPVARERLEAKAEAAIVAFEATAERDKFRDYQAILEYLQRPDPGLSRFIAYHDSRKHLARVALSCVWNQLVEARRWDICADYLADFQARYESALYQFDRTMALSETNPSLGGPQFAEHVKQRYVREFGNLVAALRNAGRPADASAIEEALVADMSARKFPELIARVMVQAAR